MAQEIGETTHDAPVSGLLLGVETRPVAVDRLSTGGDDKDGND
jgi:hypothetical protein